MTTFPAPRATLANWRTAPHNAWAFHHVREIVPSAEIAHDPDRVRPLERSPRDLSGYSIDSTAGRLTFDAVLSQTHTDGLVILHKGRVIHEEYRNAMGPRDPHILMSVSKSMLGLLTGVLVDRGVLDVAAPATAYLPELAPTAFAGATVRDLLDMRTGITFAEDYLATEGAIVDYRKATNWNPPGPGEAPSDLRGFFLTLTGSDGPHGGIFDYKSPCTDLLGWIIERAAGRRYGDLFSDLIWQPLGAETAAYITVDRLGAPRTAGGMCVTTRDLARIGQMVAEGGGGIVPTAWIEDITTAGDPVAWAAGSMAEYFPGEAVHYRSKWYVFRDRGPVLMCLGIHGQNLFIDPASELVMAKHSSHPEPLDPTGERLALRLFEAIRADL